jgi:hypothetical protein
MSKIKEIEKKVAALEDQVQAQQSTKVININVRMTNIELKTHEYLSERNQLYRNNAR